MHRGREFALLIQQAADMNLCPLVLDFLTIEKSNVGNCSKNAKMPPTFSEAWLGP